MTATKPAIAHDLPPPDSMISKVAAVTLAFWAMKILATTLGETAGDFLSMTLNLGYWLSLGITVAALVAILSVQIGLATFNPAVFWLAIIATTTAGTEISDLIDRTLGLGYLWGSLLLVAGLAITLAVWWRRNRDLRIYPIVERPTECLFWVAVVFSNSLGTAFGDFLTDNMGLSYIEGALVTAGVIALVVLLHYTSRINDVFLFWIAFIFTRPFGATFGDLLTKPLEKGGLNLPREYASLCTLVLLAAVLFLSMRRAAPRQHRREETDMAA